jgi:hypothetical protein
VSWKVESHPEGASGDFIDEAFHFEGTTTGEEGSFLTGVEQPLKTMAIRKIDSGLFLVMRDGIWSYSELRATTGSSRDA